MKPDLSEELRTIQDTVRRFAAKHVGPHAQEWDRSGGYPAGMIAKVGQQGLMGVIVPEEYGGAGGTYSSLAIVLEEMARRDGGLALAMEAHNVLVCGHILIAGTEAQKQKYLPPLAMGQQIGSWCLSEPESGTDAAALSTRAEHHGKEWLLNGSKQFITNGKRAGTFIITASTSPGLRNRGITTFIVERDTPGLKIGRVEEKHGMRSSDTVQILLDDARVPAENVLGRENAGFGDVKKALHPGRIMIAALSLGLARGAIEDAVVYANERRTFGKRIAKHQLIQQKLADMATEFEAARCLVYRGVAMLDAGRVTDYDASVIKLFASEAATRICMHALQIHGGYGYLRDYNVERYLRDAKLCEIGEGTSEILRVLIANALSARAEKA